MYARLLRLLLVLFSRLVGNELLLNLVRVQKSGLLTVGFINLVLVRRRCYIQEVVKCYTKTLGSLNFIPQSKYFLIYSLQSVIGLATRDWAPIVIFGRDLPSLLHAATTMKREAKMPTVKTDSLIFVGGVERGKTGDTPLMCRVFLWKLF